LLLSRKISDDSVNERRYGQKKLIGGVKRLVLDAPYIKPTILEELERYNSISLNMSGGRGLTQRAHGRAHCNRYVPSSTKNTLLCSVRVESERRS